MTRTTNARVAGITYLLHIAISIRQMILFGRATRGDGIAARLATALGGTDPPEPAAAHASGALLLKAGGWKTLVGATFFAVGSTCFSWLLLRGRMIPVTLAWIGVLASVLLVVALPLQLVGVLRGPFTNWIWLPMAAFEIPLGLWFMVRGAGNTPARTSEAA